MPSNKFEMSWTPQDFEKRIDKHWDALRKPVAEAMKSGQQMTISETVRRMSQHRYNGSSIRSIQGGSHSLNQLYGNTGFKVGSHDIGVNIMEFGREPNSKAPPTSSIKEWLNTSSDAEAYNVARIIGIKGIKRTQPLLKAQKAIFSRVNDMVAQAMEKVLDNLGL